MNKEQQKEQLREEISYLKIKEGFDRWRKKFGKYASRGEAFKSGVRFAEKIFNKELNTQLQQKEAELKEAKKEVERLAEENTQLKQMVPHQFQPYLSTSTVTTCSICGRYEWQH